MKQNFAPLFLKVDKLHSRLQGSNLRHQDLQSCATSTELNRVIFLIHIPTASGIAASTGNRTRGSRLEGGNFTTKPLMLYGFCSTFLKVDLLVTIVFSNNERLGIAVRY